MTKRIFSKTIAIMLVASMCFVAVFTGAVSAETRTATCTVTGKGYDVGARDSLVYANVTFQSGTAFTAGSFEVSAEDLTLVDCSPAVENDGDQPNVKLNVLNKRVLFYGFSESADYDIKSYTDLTLVLKFTINKGSLYNSAAGTKWDVTVSNINITNVAEETYTTADAATTTAVPIHVHNYTDASENGSFTTETCSICGATHAKVTNTTGLGSNDLKTNAAANVTFDEIGDTVLNALLPVSVVENVDNVYFIYHYTVDENGVDTEKTGTTVSTGTVTYNGTTYHVFPCGRNGGIGRISRDVTGNFVVNGSPVTISAPWSYSIQKYCNALIDGSYDEDEKNYAKALLNYGYWTTDALVNEGKTSYKTDKATYGDNMPITLTHFVLPTSKAAVVDGHDDNWNLASGLTVTTGFKPKMNIKFTDDTINMDTITVQVKDGTKVVYYKEIATSIIASNSNTYVLSDVPTKYLVGDIVIGAKKNGNDSNKTITYSYAKYAKARANKSDANVFQSLMDYASYLKAAF